MVVRWLHDPLLRWCELHGRRIGDPPTRRQRATNAGHAQPLARPGGPDEIRPLHPHRHSGLVMAPSEAEDTSEAYLASTPVS
jgi:hypothetical protein